MVPCVTEVIDLNGSIMWIHWALSDVVLKMLEYTVVYNWIVNAILVSHDLTRFEHCTSTSNELPIGFHWYPGFMTACLRYKYVAGMQAMCARTLLQLVPDAQMVAWHGGIHSSLEMAETLWWPTVGRLCCWFWEWVHSPQIEVLLRQWILFVSQAWKRSIQCKQWSAIATFASTQSNCSELQTLWQIFRWLPQTCGRCLSLLFPLVGLTSVFFSQGAANGIWFHFVQPIGGGMTSIFGTLQVFDPFCGSGTVLIDAWRFPGGRCHGSGATPALPWL